jgi:signal transduction histidine kinase
VVELVNTALRRSRGLAHGFDPVLVEAQGLVAALGNLAAQTRDLYGLHCVFACRQEQLPVNAETSLALYRITQEAIHNAHTHGRARHVKATLELDETQLCLRIRDDGQGAPPQPQPHSGMGWRIMHYRANSIGGHLTINSSLGQGTEIVCRVPRKLCLEEEETKVPRRC